MIKAEIKFIESDTFDPFQNLEEEKKYFESNLNTDLIVRFWTNDRAVIMGKFQKEEYEVDLDLAKELKIPIIRRFSGGGTVYHDKGVLNISVIKDRNFFLYSSYFLEEAKFLTEVLAKTIESLLKVQTIINERNGIFIFEKKVAGSSVAISKNFLYHASVLVDADIKLLNAILKGKPYESGMKGFVKSVKSEVANLKEFNDALTKELLKEKIKEHFIELLK